ncbi:PilZ domain-containing protein [Actinoplanes sp. NPDC048796]|uniref:PilZ domain-containing protein n=1 Tax=unclassified Actinoplanes TaxID=2626549 RepID=UPI0033D9E2BB
MSAPLLPADGSYVEMTSFGETMPEVRVVQSAGTVITLSLAVADLPPAHSTVTLRWAAAPRGRYALSAQVMAIDGNRVDLRFSGEPAIEQSRDYVRGGGGEPIVLLLEGQEPAQGQVHDLSEHSVRARFTDVTVRPGDEVTLRIQLDDEIVVIPAQATKVSSMRQQVPARGPLQVELVAIFPEIGEHQATIVRRYILQAQLRARAQY